MDVLADLPQWAVEAGLPRAYENESLRTYCVRMMFTKREIASLFVELTERTACIANLRLACLLRKKLPTVWRAYVLARREPWT